MQTLTLGSTAKVQDESAATTHLAMRLARLTAQLEEVLFERDLAHHAHAHLAEEYRALAQQQQMATSSLPPALINELELTRRQRAQLEYEAELLRQQCEHWRAAHDRLAAEQQQLLRQAADSALQLQELQTYAVSLRQFQTMVQHSRRWRFIQFITGLLGRRWR